MRKTKDGGHRSINEAMRAERHAAENSQDTTVLSFIEREVLKEVRDWCGKKYVKGMIGINADWVAEKKNFSDIGVETALEDLKSKGLIEEDSHSRNWRNMLPYEIRCVATPKGIRALKRQ
jgi:hypothetical protein